MITSFEVGAVFKLVNEASPTLAKLAKQFADFDKLIKDSIRHLGEFDALIKNFGAAGLATKVTGEFTAIDTAIGSTMERVIALKAELAGLGTGLAPAIIPGGRKPATGGPVLPGARAVSPLTPRFGNLSVPTPGGGRLHVPGGPVLAGGLALGYGVLEAAQIDSSINRMMITGGVAQPGQDIHQNKFYDPLRGAIMESYAMTGMPLHEIEEAIAVGTRGLAGLPLEKRLKIMPTLLRSVSTEAYLKEGTTLKEAMEAQVGLGHQGAVYDERLEKLSEDFAYLSTTTPSSVSQMARAAGYAIPMLRTADFDPAQLLLMITSMERAGIQNTKAGTWIANLAMQSFPGTSLMSKMLFKKHEEALKSLGLVDDKDQPTWFTDGKPDLVKMTGIAGEHIQAMDPAHRLAVEKALWGTQGGKAGAMFSDPVTRQIMANVAEEKKSFLPGKEMWKQIQENDPMIQLRRGMAQFNMLLIDIGTVLLPRVITVLKIIDGAFKVIGFVDSTIANALQSLAKKDITGFGAWSDKMFNSQTTPDKAMKNLKDIEAKRRLTTVNPADTPAPDSSPMSGFWPDGVPQSFGAIHDGVLAALNDWGGGLGRGGGGGGGLLRSMRYGVGSGGGVFSGGGGAGVRGVGVNDRALRLMNILIGRGWTKEGAATAAAEAYGESAITAGGPTGDHGHSHNMFQWDARRWSGFHGNPNDFDAVVNYFDHERIAHGQGGWNSVHSIGTGIMMGKAFEGYADKSGHTERYRGGLANSFYGLLNQPKKAAPESHIHHVQINIDGRKVAHAVAHQLTKDAWAPRRGPYHDPYGHPTSSDVQYAMG